MVLVTKSLTSVEVALGYFPDLEEEWYKIAVHKAYSGIVQVVVSR